MTQEKPVATMNLCPVAPIRQNSLRAKWGEEARQNLVPLTTPLFSVARDQRAPGHQEKEPI